MQVLADNDAEGTENGLNGLAGQLGVVVLLGEVAEPYMTQMLTHVVGDSLATKRVVQMTAAGDDAGLQVLRIRTVHEHLHIVVCFDDEIVCPADAKGYLVGDMSHIGDDAEHYIAGNDFISYVVTTVVRHREGCHRKGPYLQCHARLDIAAQIGSHLLGYTVVAIDALVNDAGGIDGQVLVVAETAYGLDMVSMIVGDEYVVNAGEAQAVVPEVLLQSTDTDTGIDEQSVTLSFQIVAVTTASASH